jgi:hypothetical protein
MCIAMVTQPKDASATHKLGAHYLNIQVNKLTSRNKQFKIQLQEMKQGLAVL